MDHHACSVLRALEIAGGAKADYLALEGFHYRGGRPRGVLRIFAARCGGTLAGVLVETVPPLNCAARETLLRARYACLDRRARALAINRDVRTIARVIVHPLFRGTGVGTALVKHALARAQTPYVEAFAAMGRVHPLFERAGMRRIDVPLSRQARQLLAALDAARLRPIDLVDAAASRMPAAVRRALRLFAKDKEAGPGNWLEEARHRLLSRPVYYFWSMPAVS
jgi:GNAT superfamily N-acetyltransferase